MTWQAAIDITLEDLRYRRYTKRGALDAVRRLTGFYIEQFRERCEGCTGPQQFRFPEFAKAKFTVGQEWPCYSDPVMYVRFQQVDGDWVETCATGNLSEWMQRTWECFYGE